MKEIKLTEKEIETIAVTFWPLSRATVQVIQFASEHMCILAENCPYCDAVVFDDKNLNNCIGTDHTPGCEYE